MLHDLYMAHRFDRATAQELGILPVLNRLASIWREEDHRSRGGRRSWRKPAAVLDENPYLRAIRAPDLVDRRR